MESVVAEFSVFSSTMFRSTPLDSTPCEIEENIQGRVGCFRFRGIKPYKALVRAYTDEPPSPDSFDATQVNSAMETSDSYSSNWRFPFHLHIPV